MKTLLKNVIDIYVWVERFQNIPRTILLHFFHVSSASVFQNNVTPPAKSLLAGLGFLDAEPAEMSIFSWRIGAVIPAGVLGKPDQGRLKVF